jgi:hypothetical protein
MKQKTRGIEFFFLKKKMGTGHVDFHQSLECNNFETSFTHQIKCTQKRF